MLDLLRVFKVRRFYSQKPSLGRLLDDERGQLITEKYRATLQAFNVPTVSSTTDSSDTDGGRYPRRITTGSDMTGLLVELDFVISFFLYRNSFLYAFRVLFAVLLLLRFSNNK